MAVSGLRPAPSSSKPLHSVLALAADEHNACLCWACASSCSSGSLGDLHWPDHPFTLDFRAGNVGSNFSPGSFLPIKGKEARCSSS